MAVLKCKMCGGDIIAAEGQTYGTCDSCGSTITLPNINDQRMENLFNRANHFRMVSEFDKAVATYEMILNEDNSNAEAHWGLLLSRYGIEYVEDPASHERIPTCHRIQNESILSDDDYISAIQNAPDSYTRSLYEAEGKRLSELQRGLLQVSAQTDPFDIFICYKETTEGGTRTNDSALAQDIYYQLTNAGYKVFFSRVTLESMLGQQYEPHIFAALNSAKVMLAIGTKPEYFNAVWVKNEWSRFLALSKKDRSKVLIPCYRDMNVYDLPDELSMLQSQDMAKIGFMQDLLHGIEKVINAQSKEEKVQPAQTAAAPGVESLYKRAILFLEDGDFQQADEYFDRILDIDPEFAPAYIGRLQVERKKHIEADLANCHRAFDEDSNYKKALRFANPQQKAIYEGYNAAIHARIEAQRFETNYNNALSLMNAARNEKDYHEAAESFAKIATYKDAAQLEDKCLKKAEELRIENERKETERKALEEQERIARQQKAEADRLERERQAEVDRIAEEKKKTVRKRITLVVAFITVVLIGAGVLTTKVIIPNSKYDKAVSLFENGNYENAISEFEKLNGYKDSETQIQAAYYQMGLQKLEESDTVFASKYFTASNGYADAATHIEKIEKYRQAHASIYYGDDASARPILVELGDYLGAAELLQGCYEREYANALALYNSGDYAGAYSIFAEIPEYSDSTTYTQQLEADYQAAEKLLSEGSYDEASAAFTALKNYADSAEKANSSIYTKAEALFAAGSYDEAAAVYDSLGEYSDSAEKANFSIYTKAESLRVAGSYDEAIAVYASISNYSDSVAKINECHYQKASAYLSNGQKLEAEAEFMLIEDYSDVADILNTLRLDIADSAFAEKNYGRALEYYLKLEQTDELKAKEYTLAQACYEEGYYEQAVLAYEILGQYELSVSKLPVARYAYASQLFDKAEYAKAAEQFMLLNGYTDSVLRIRESNYLYGKQLMEQGLWTEAKDILDSVSDYSDAKEQVKECGYQLAEITLAEGDYAKAQIQYTNLGDYKDSAEKVDLCIYEQGNAFISEGDYTKAEKRFSLISEYADSTDKIKLCRYEQGNACYAAADYAGALDFYTDLNYEDSEILAAKCWYERGMMRLSDGKFDHAVAEFAQATILPEAQEMLCSIAKDYAATNQVDKAIITLWAAGEYEPAKALLTEISDLMKTSGDNPLAVMASIAAGLQVDTSLCTADEFAEKLASIPFLKGSSFKQTMRYSMGMAARDNGEYDKARRCFAIYMAQSNTAEGTDLVKETYYLEGLHLLDEGKYSKARGCFKRAEDYQDSATQIQKGYYLEGLELLDNGDYVAARRCFGQAGDYEDAATQIQRVHYLEGLAALNDGEYSQARSSFTNAGDYEDAAAQILKTNYLAGLEAQKVGNTSLAQFWFDQAGDYADAVSQSEGIKKAFYENGCALLKNGDLVGALKAFEEAGDYLNASKLVCVLSAESMDLETAINILFEETSSPTAGSELLDLCKELQQCTGRYQCYQKQKKDGTMTTKDIGYWLTLDFYLSKGIPYLHVVNSLFHDTTIYDAPVEKGGDYTFVAHCPTSKGGNKRENFWFSTEEAKYTGHTFSNVYFYKKAE